MRFDIDTFTEITDSLTRNKSRSFLTGFGIFWGIFMLLFLMGGGQGVKDMLYSNFEGFATNTTIIVSDRTSEPYAGFQRGRYWNLSYTDVDRIKTMVPGLETVTPQVSNWGQNAIFGENSVEANVRGIYADYAMIETPKIKYGRFLNDADVRQERKVCVIGKRIYEALFPEGGDPCGQRIKVGPVYYQIVGVDFNAGNISINGSADMAVTVPLPVVQKVYGRGDVVDLICMTGKSGVSMTAVEPILREVMAREHKFNPDDKQAMFVLNTEEMFSLVDNLFIGINFLILLIGLGTILAGAIGVSNIMMVTVKERTTEIGIRRAIGATPRDILGQIIMESISLTLLAGSLGIVFSVFMLNILEALNGGDTSFQVGFWTAVAAMAFLAVLGVLAGLAPASRAMNIKPVDAMRDE